MKTGVIDVGGGLRGIYAAGVFDYCLDHGVGFDYGIGISAGSANLASFMGGQRGRNYAFYHDYSSRKEYMGLGSLIATRSFLNLDYLYRTLSVAGGENPLNYEGIAASPLDWRVEATDARTGKPHYFTKADMHQDDYRILMASSAIPVACQPPVVDGVPYFDGALGDPVPVQKAFDEGCDKVVVLLTKPADFLRDPASDVRAARLIRRKWPNAARGLELRAQRYNEGVALAKEYAQKGRALLVAPDDTCGIKTLTRDKDALDRLYKKGYADARAIPVFLGNAR